MVNASSQVLRNANAIKMNFVLRCCVFAFVSYLAEGKAYSLPYISDRNCKDNATEYFVEDVGKCCSKCKPGSRLVQPCTMKVDTVCETCREGTYIESANYHRNCFSCKKCNEAKGLQYIRSCTSTSASVCVCMSGQFCSGKMDPSCDRCKKYRTCPPGQGANGKIKDTQDIQCAPCPAGTFSDETSYQQCQPHRRCEGRSVLTPGTPTSDTVCGPGPSPAPTTLQTSTTPRTTITTTTAAANSSTASKKPNFSPGKSDSGYWIGLGVTATVLLLLILLTLAFIIRHRKGLTKPEVKGAAMDRQSHDISVDIGTTEQQQLLLSDSKSDPSTSSTSSSCSDSSGPSAGNSQDLLVPEPPPPSISNPFLNFSVITTTTINYQLDPLSVPAPVPSPGQEPLPQPCLDPGPEPHLSQEEERGTTCQQEDGKEALQSVQESEWAE